jgi:hypothetical protein
MKVKIITASDPLGLERQVNDWLDAKHPKDIIAMRYSTAGMGMTTHIVYSVAIFYK